MNKENLQKYIPENVNPEITGNVATFEMPLAETLNVIIGLYKQQELSLKLITATDEREKNGCFKIRYIFGIPGENFFLIPFIQLKNTEEFPSVCHIIPMAGSYERKIKTFFGLTPVGNPDLRPLILHENWPKDVFPLRKDFALETKPAQAQGKYEFQKVAGEGIYEIPVGPIHAGIIEPGHFRFSMAGESIVLLEARLGFVHKGSEKLFEALPIDKKLVLSEKISGDSSFSHSLAFCQALENLSNIQAPKRALYLRTVFAELERLANHFGDIGAIMIDTGFNFGGANGARLREMVMRIHERLTGSRFLRGVNTVGGVTKDIDATEAEKLKNELKDIIKDFSQVVTIASRSASLLNRLKSTGKLNPEIARARGVIGVPAKALGIKIDARVDFPYAAYREIALNEIATETDGDVYSRFMVRVKEAYASAEIIERALNEIPTGEINIGAKEISFQKNSLAVSIVEGWRGEIVYFVTTDKNGNIDRVDPRDPSFINWNMLGDAGLNNIIPDFPLINKSFNLSYSGNDV